jgi:DNA-binding FadR family transcriptional regulator
MPMTDEAREAEDDAATLRQAQPFKSLERQSTTAAVVNALQAMILDRRLKPGDALPSERELSTLLAVSRNVLREALGILGQRGLVESRHGTGTYVSLPSSRQARDALMLLLELGRVSLVQLCDARILIEPELAFIAAQRDDDVGRAALQAAWSALQAAGDGEHHVANDLAFHGAIASLANHAVLRALVDAVKEPVMRGMVLGTKVPRAIEDSNRQHEAILAAILDNDAERARTEMFKHLLFVRGYLAADEGAGDGLPFYAPTQRGPSPLKDLPRAARAGSDAMRQGRGGSPSDDG